VDEDRFVIAAVKNETNFNEGVLHTDEVAIFDAATGSLVRKLSADGHPIIAIAAARLGKRVIAGTADGMLVVWNTDDTTPVATAPAHDGEIRLLSVSENGDTVVTAGSDRCLRLWTIR
jgi:WD40 repeat protein